MVEKKSASSFFISKYKKIKEKEKSIKEINKDTSKKSIFISRDVVNLQNNNRYYLNFLTKNDFIRILYEYIMLISSNVNFKDFKSLNIERLKIRNFFL